MLGLTEADFAKDTFEVWPENWQAYEVFRWMDTQWLWTMGQRLGLNYQTLYMRLDRMALDEESREQMEFDLRSMESAALEQISADAETDS